MYLKAMLVCDDVRFEINGTFTLVGVPSGRYVLDVRTGFSELNVASTAALPATPGLVSEQHGEFLPWLPDLLMGPVK